MVGCLALSPTEYGNSTTRWCRSHACTSNQLAQCRNIITILPIENVQIFFTKADRQWLNVAGTDIDIGKNG